MKLKIVNKKKFIRGICVVTIVLYFALCAVTNKVSSNEILTYKTIIVNSGDTLWSIAQSEQLENDYYKDSDIREIVYNIKEVNNLKTSNLKVQQNLKIPTK
ncbi:MAG: LysM peptidoglycan-binding domain-containing protein [Clostridia bacterium]|nr:LysM peptidoglycan-binding domain-containing protein [Clostridia bacterium]